MLQLIKNPFYFSSKFSVLVSIFSLNGLKGNPVKIRGYPRSCKSFQLLSHLCHCLYKYRREGRFDKDKPEDLPVIIKS